MLKIKFKKVISVLIMLLLLSSLSFATETDPIGEDISDITPISDNIDETIETPIDAIDSLEEINTVHGDIYEKNMKDFVLNELISGNVFISTKDFTISPREDGGIIEYIDGDMYIIASNVRIASNIIYSSTQLDSENNPAIENILSSAQISGNVYVIANKLTLEPGCIIDGSLYVIANEIEIKQYSSIRGNLFATANKLTFNGWLSKDLYAKVKTFDMSYGYIVRDLHLISDKATINAAIIRNAFIESKQLVTKKDFMNYGNLEVKAQEFILVGEVLGNLKADTKNFYIITPDNIEDNKKIIEKNDELLYLLEDDTIFSTAIYGNLDYTAKEELTLADGVVDGEINYTKYPTVSIFMKTLGSHLLNIATLLCYVFAVYLVMKKLSPNLIENSSIIDLKTLLTSFGVGIGLIILLPIVVALLCLIKIGIPIAALLSLVYILFIFISVPTILITLSTFIQVKTGNKLNEYIFLAIISIIFSLLLLIPYVNILIALIAILVGIGNLALISFKKS